MTLNTGRQKEHFMQLLPRHSPQLEDGYQKIYKHNQWGAAVPKYYQRLEQRFIEAAHAHQISRRIPPSLFWSVCTPKEAVEVTLQQLDYLQRAAGGTFPYSKLAAKISDLDSPSIAPREISEQLRLNEEEKTLLKEIATTRGSSFYKMYQ